MVSADPIHSVVRMQVESVTFGFYTDEDVRARSVIEITSPQAFDALGTPLPGGLYDPRLGPMDKKVGALCVTCACPYHACTGHMGTIELCVPLYHPILFPYLLKLLRCKCFACHKFRIPSIPMKIIQCKFYLASRGRLQEALELDSLLAQQNFDSNLLESKEGRKISGNNTDAIEAILLEKQEYGDSVTHTFIETSYEREYKRQLVKEFFAACAAAQKCSNCGAFSPKIRQYESSKLFQSRLPASSARINAAEGITLKPALKITVGGDNVDDDNDEDNEESNTTDTRDKFMHSLEVEAQVRRTWETEPMMCHYIFCGDLDAGYRVFFLRAVAVPPSRFRPPMMLANMTVENAQNLYLNRLLVANDKVRTLMAAGELANAISTWIEMQTTLNIYFDSSKDPKAGSNTNNGIRQILEKKEGIFRKHMMGKRVDFCCRSVISPDPYIGTDEIGIPLHFARTLTFPTPVSNLNILEMRELIRRGPERYPGALWVQYPDGRRVDLSKMNDANREGIASRLMTIVKRGGAPPIVGRQLRDGDMVLANRQVSFNFLFSFTLPKMIYQSCTTLKCIQC
jgi:DNA-directed RNA polymerase I subunit RPA1